MLGRLKMDVDECINAYNKLSSQAFTRKALFPIDKHCNIKERFDSKQLELALKSAVMDRGYDEDTLLKDPDTSCRVVLCATQGETGRTVALRSYANDRNSSELYNTASIWEAGRATSAASTFFDPITIGPNRQTFLDGATGSNNPIRHLWVEAQDVWSSRPLEDQIGCIVSIGTGVPKAVKPRTNKIGGLKYVKENVLDTEQDESEFAQEHPCFVANNQYFRFNVPDDLARIGLEKVGKIDEIVDITQHHLAKDTVRVQVQTCAESLCKAKGILKVSPWEVTGLIRSQSRLSQSKCIQLKSSILYLMLMVFEDNASNQGSTSCASYEPGPAEKNSRTGKFLGLFGSKKPSVAV